MKRPSPQPQRASQPYVTPPTSPHLHRGLPSTQPPSPKLQQAGLRRPKSPQPQRNPAFMFDDKSK